MISSQVVKNIYTGDGNVVSFPFTFPLPPGSTGSEIQVYVFDTGGNLTLLTSNYTIDLNNGNILYPTVAGVAPLPPLAAALPLNWQLVVAREEPLTQNLSLTNTGPFDAPSVMNSMDKIVMMIQQLQEQVSRCIKFPINMAPTPSDINAAIAALGALVAPMTKGTYAVLKAQATQNPLGFRFGYATDLGQSGMLMFYCGDSSVGDGGWFGPIVGQ